jgi:hypothetical protein
MITNISIVHNVVGGHYGNSSYGTSGVYLSANPGIGIFNLLLADNMVSFTTGGANDGAIYLFNVKNSLVANNTLYDASSTYNGVRCDPTCTGVTFSNNIFAGFALNYYLVPSATTLPAHCDYNIYYGGQFRVDSSYYSFASWKGLGFDANSKTNNPLFNSVAAANYSLASNSPAIGMGVNLTALFNSDINNNIRPATGGWTVGAYEYPKGAANTNPVIAALPVSINFGSVTANSSATNTFTIYNTGGGTLTGAATVAAPFSIVSGGNYSLTNNQNQTVTLAFNPTSAGSFTQTVNFTGGGTSVAVSGVGLSTNLPPSVSPIGINASDVDASTPGFQIYGGTVVSLSATATNALTYQWSYTVNGGSPVVFQGGLGSVPAASFSYGTGTIGNTYVWTLSVSNNQGAAQSQFTLNVEAAPLPSASLVFAAQSGLITNPFVLGTNGTSIYVYQPIQTVGISGNGVAVYNFMVTNAGNYEVQALVNAPNSGANSLYVNIDAMPQDPNMTWDILTTSGFEERLVSWRGSGSDTANQFVPWIFNLTVGSHQIIFCGREANTQLSGFSILQAPPTPPPPTIIGQ